MSMTKDRGGCSINGQWDTSREGERERAEKEEQEVGGGVVSYPNSEAMRGKEGRRWMIFPVVAGGFTVVGDVVGENGKKGFPAGGLCFCRLGWRRLVVGGDAGDEEERGEEGSEAAAGSDLSPENLGRRERGWSGDEGEEGVGGCMLFFRRW
ncbi:hypothetical protein HAX54_001267 [Datura stramonium]|uniref:Uncharacterized protein n=1 Tax=Datura stramonium TaxID=4076 RepID=A0ABS8Y981_DATST|nr:hypothetical protein [Datura stramonium]